MDWREVHELMNMHTPPARVNFKDEDGNTASTLVIKHCTTYTDYVDLCYSIQENLEVNKKTLL
jgi:hypothetical protein